MTCADGFEESSLPFASRHIENLHPSVCFLFRLYIDYAPQGIEKMNTTPQTWHWICRSRELNIYFSLEILFA